MQQPEHGTARGPRVDDGPPVVVHGRTRPARSGVRLCLSCGERRALFSYRGTVKADREHNLCFRCFRAERNRLRARTLVTGSIWAPLAGTQPAASRTIGDRAALMAGLQARRRRAQIMARHALDTPGPLPAADTLAS